MPTLPFRRLLVVSPHPDDLELGCGGTIDRLIFDEGGQVRQWVGVVPGWHRDEQLVKASQLLGIEHTQVWRLTKTEGSEQRRFLDEGPLAEVIDEIDRYIQEIQPDAVMLPQPHAYHQEHRAVAAAAVAALRPNAGTDKGAVPIVLTYEHGADWWGVEPAPQPRFYVALHPGNIDTKIRVFQAHESEVRDQPSERSPESIRTLAGMRGMQAGCQFAEAFGVLRWIS